MIIALDENGHYEWSTNETINHRHHKYSCPACKMSVLFRKGPQIVSHFAHLKNQACDSSSEPESVTHISGKIQLHNYIKESVDVIFLEKYFSAIQQKADIYFEYKGKGYAIEFQCSHISLELFEKRTKGYYSIGITPIWVFHADMVRKSGIYEWKMPKLVQWGRNYNDQIFLYDVNKRNLIILSQITPFSKGTFFLNEKIVFTKTIHVTHFIQKQLLPRKYLSKWRVKRHNHLCRSIRYEGLRVPFYQKLYESGLSTFNLTPFVGIPLRNGIAIQTPVIEWQGLLFLEFIKVKTISISRIYSIFMKMIEKKWIEITSIPSMKCNPKKALLEYIDLLLEIDFFVKNGNSFIVNHSIIQSIKEVEVYQILSQSNG
jgi:competence CoiA-like predicted nuclease